MFVDDFDLIVQRSPITWFNIFVMTYVWLARNDVNLTKSHGLLRKDYRAMEIESSGGPSSMACSGGRQT